MEQTAGPASRRAAVDTFLAGVVTSRPAPDPLVRRAVESIEDSHGTIALEQLATTLGCSSRHLQRLFSARVGISPKLLARIRRFQRVFSAWRDDPRSLSRVAAECGYFDQPHLIRDFRDFAGQAPAAFLANQPEFTRLFLPTRPEA
jgi:transcriptional regulator GlxA family with amidase domain